MKKSLCTIACLFLSVPAWAHHTHQPTVTDRPDSAESSGTVGPNHFQIETGFRSSHDESEGRATDIYSFPTLLRGGLGDRFELRMEGEMLALRKQSGTTLETGFTDLAFGVKIHLLDKDRWIPSLALLSHVNTPTGRNTFSANAFEPLFKILTDWDLPKDFSLSTNVGFDLPGRNEEGDKFARFLYATSVGHATPFLADQMRFFIEFTGIIPAHPRKEEEHSFDTGLTFLLNPDMQLGLFIQMGLTEITNDIVTGLGFSWRAF